MTIEENLAMAVLRGQSRGLRAASNKQRRELFHSALAPLGLGLEDRLNAFVGTLSSGQRQAVALVMATISKPALLLLFQFTCLSLKVGQPLRLLRQCEGMGVRDEVAD
jgi:putative ABC transport system ATP-binding protein